MPKYKITFNIEPLVRKLLPSASSVDVVGFDIEVTLTIPTDLTTTQINNIKAKLPFSEVTKL
jgi:hypothetical protein